MVPAPTFGSFRRAKSTREAGSTASTVSARGACASGPVPSRSSCPRESASDHANGVSAPGWSTAGTRRRRIMEGRVYR